MTKRKASSPPSRTNALQQRNNGDEEISANPTALGHNESTIAKNLVRQQQERQKRRRKSSDGGIGSCVKTSLWSTHAAIVSLQGKRSQFQCNVCGHVGSLNRNVSTSNIISHYQHVHEKLHQTLLQLNASSAPPDVIDDVLKTSRAVYKKKNNYGSLTKFFKPRSGAQNSVVWKPQPQIDAKLSQAVGAVLFACASEMPLGKIGSPLLQGLVDIYGGRVMHSSKTHLEGTLLDTYNAVCALLRVSVNEALTGNLTIDGWSAALGAPILGMTWHFIDKDWKLQMVPISTLNIGGASKNGEQMRSIMQETLEQSPIVGSDDIRVFTATSDNEAATALAVDLLTNYVGSVRCVVHTIALAVKDVFEVGTPWQKVMNHVNRITTYFNQHPKASQLFVRKQLNEGVSNDRLQRLKHDIPTRWHSKLGAMWNYFARKDTIASVADELNIGTDELPALSSDQLETLSEFICILAEVRRVARQLEADKKVTLSRAPRLLRELYETLLIMAGKMLLSTDSNVPQFSFDTVDTINASTALSSRASTAHSDKERDRARSNHLQKGHAKALATRLALRIKERLGVLWKRVDKDVATWYPSHDDDTERNSFSQEFAGNTPSLEMRQPKRVLLFHVAALLDVNECGFDFLDCSYQDKENYTNLIIDTVVREVLELDPSLLSHRTELRAVFKLFHREMYGALQAYGRREPQMALQYWKDVNEQPGLISPTPFNCLARAALSAQASSASAERLFSDLGRLEGNQRQSLLTGTLEMTEVVRSYVNGEIGTLKNRQSTVLHPTASAFRRTVLKVAQEISKKV